MKKLYVREKYEKVYNSIGPHILDQQTF